MTRLWAAVLYGGQGACVSHLSAAWWLWKLEGLGTKAPQEIDLLIPHGRRLRAAAGLRIRRSRELQSGRDTTVRNGLPCTTLARTLVDLAAVLDRKTLEQAMESAQRRDRATGDAALAVLNRMGSHGRPGASALTALATAHPLGPTSSPLEVEMRQLIEAAGLPAPMTQLAITDDDTGEQIGVVDFAWPEKRVIVLTHSRYWHSTQRAVANDFDQHSDLTAAGWRVLPVTSRRLHDQPEWVIDQLGKLLLT
jgi:hypothetical protein